MKKEKLTRHDIFKIIAKKTKISQTEISDILEEFFNTIYDQTVNNNKIIELRGIGIFKAQEFKERKRKNPHTGEIMTCKSSKVLRFKLSSKIKRG